MTKSKQITESTQRVLGSNIATELTEAELKCVSGGEHSRFRPPPGSPGDGTTPGIPGGDVIW